MDKKSAKEIRIELAKVMIQKYIESIGYTREKTYFEEKDFWCWQQGSAYIEVLIQSVKIGKNKTREYLRIFSYLADIPQLSVHAREKFLTRLLEMNDKNLGVKLTLMHGSNKIYATYERDIVGMDYSELSTCIADLAWWADKLDDELKSIMN